MDMTSKQHIEELDISEHWFVSFFIRVLLASVFLTAILLWVGMDLLGNH